MCIRDRNLFAKLNIKIGALIISISCILSNLSIIDFSNKLLSKVISNCCHISIVSFLYSSICLRHDGGAIGFILLSSRYAPGSRYNVLFIELFFK